jgi:hypothetical protein
MACLDAHLYEIEYSLFNEFVCKLGFLWHERFKCPQVPKKPNLHKNELNTTIFLFNELQIA